MKKVVIVNAYGRSNRGDSVLLDECVQEVKKIGDVSISVSLFDKSNMSPLYDEITLLDRVCNPVTNSRLLNLLYKLWGLIFVSLYLLTGLNFLLNFISKKQKETIKAIMDADYVISSPGGYIHDTNFAYIVALLHIALANKSKAISILGPQSYGPLNSYFGRKITKKVLNKADAICCRESYSYDFLFSCGVDSQLLYKTGDSAFWNFEVDYQHYENDILLLGLKPNEEYFGITVVDWSFPNVPNPSELKERYIETIRFLIEGVYTKFKIRTVIFNQVKDDLEIIPSLINGLENVVVVDRLEKEPNRLRALIGKSKIFLGTRFHSCIFSLMSSTPTRAIAYLPKTEYILKDLGLQDRQVSINDLNKEMLLDQILYDFENVDSQSNVICNAVLNYQKSNKRLFDIIKLKLEKNK